MADVECKHLPEVREDGATDSSKTGQRAMKTGIRCCADSGGILPFGEVTAIGCR